VLSVAGCGTSTLTRGAADSLALMRVTRWAGLLALVFAFVFALAFVVLVLVVFDEDLAKALLSQN